MKKLKPIIVYRLNREKAENTRNTSSYRDVESVYVLDETLHVTQDYRTIV